MRHHLIDVLDVTETATVAEFQALARAAIADCTPGSSPILVGGSALYVRAVLDDFSSPAPTPIRARPWRRSWPRGPGGCMTGSPSVDPAAGARSCRATAGGSSARSR